METLTNEEMLEIEGGTWIEEAGASFYGLVFAFAIV